MTVLLDLRNVRRHFQSGDTLVRALDDVSLQIHAGEFVAIMGQSGSGKSTLMNIIGCLDRMTSGTYSIMGRDVAPLLSDDLADLRRRTFGFVFQRYNLLATATAAENVALPGLYDGMAADERKTRAGALLEKLGLAARGGHRPSQLSGGQQQRVAIARALMNDPPVILADEPTGALDSQSGQDVMALLKDLHADGRTVIVITHDEKVAAYANRVIHLHDGKVESDSGLADAPVTVPARPQRRRNVLAEAAEAFLTAARSLRVNIFRTALTLLGIVIGVAAVVTMMAIGNGSKEKMLDQISAMGTHTLSIRPDSMGSRGAADIASLTKEDAAALEGLPNVQYVVPERSTRTTLRYGNIDYTLPVAGVSPALPQVRDWPVKEGVFFNDRDMDASAAVIVLGQTAAQALFKNNENPVGKYVLVRNIPFEVIGVLSAKGATPWGADQDDGAFVPLTTGIARLFGRNYVGHISVKVENFALIDDTEELIRQTLLGRHKVEDFRIRNTASIIETIESTQNTLTILLGSVAAISLLVGGIGVMNIMLVSVTERTREIGIRMATGARQSDVMMQFNIEATVVCVTGGLIGVALGFAAGAGLSWFGVDILFTAAPAAMAFLSAVLTGLLFGYLPARKAARMDPVMALASE